MAQMTPITCPGCGQLTQIPYELFGQVVKCPHCPQTFQLALSVVQPVASVAPTGPVPAAPAPISQPSAPPASTSQLSPAITQTQSTLKLPSRGGANQRQRVTSMLRASGHETNQSPRPTQTLNSQVLQSGLQAQATVPDQSVQAPPEQTAPQPPATPVQAAPVQAQTTQQAQLAPTPVPTPSVPATQSAPQAPIPTQARPVAANQQAAPAPVSFDNLELAPERVSRPVAQQPNLAPQRPSANAGGLDLLPEASPRRRPTRGNMTRQRSGDQARRAQRAEQKPSEGGGFDINDPKIRAILGAVVGVVLLLVVVFVVFGSGSLGSSFESVREGMTTGEVTKLIEQEPTRVRHFVGAQLYIWEVGEPDAGEELKSYSIQFVDGKVESKTIVDGKIR